MQPQIATHVSPGVYATTLGNIIREASEMTETQIIERCQLLTREIEKWSSKMIHDPGIQDSCDRMYKRWIDEASEMLAIWATVNPGKSAR